MELILTLEHLVALGIGATVATILVTAVVSSRLKEALAGTKSAAIRSASHALQLDAEKARHKESMRLQSVIRDLLTKAESDARIIAVLEKARNDQMRDEIRTLNQIVAGAGEKLAGLDNEFASWTAFGLELQSWIGQVEEDEGDLPALNHRLLELLGERKSVITSIEEIHSDEEAGSEDDTREVAAVKA